MADGPGVRRNLGVTGLKARGGGDAMRAYDALPLPLRRWMAGAALPWSAASCRRIWQRAIARGESVEAILSRLDRAERATLARVSSGLAAARATASR